MAEVETKEQTEPPSLWHRFRSISRDVRRGFIAEWTVTVILLLFATTTLVQAFVIPSASMENTILIGDHVLVDKLTYAPNGALSGVLPYRDVRRGDIIVFRFPLDIKQDYVKRAIGVPGDRIHLENKQLFLNGRAVTEPYVIHRTDYINEYRDNFPRAIPEMALPERARDMLEHHVENGDLVVPKGYVFAMGDNRDDSLDSRYWGFVPRENIEGTPLIIYWSFDAPTQALTDPNIGIDHIIDVVTNFFGKTRWSRTFKLIKGYPLK